VAVHVRRKIIFLMVQGGQFPAIPFPESCTS
jgi:hypothetical protein